MTILFVVAAHATSYQYQVLATPAGDSAASFSTINNAGQIYGVFTDSTGNLNGFLDSNGIFSTTVTFPATPANCSCSTSAESTSGEIAGTGALPAAFGGTTFVGFSDKNGTPQFFTAGFQSGYIQSVSGINNSGQIVGSAYVDFGNQLLGFVRDQSGNITYSYQLLASVPAIANTSFTGIDNSGDIFGFYIGTGNSQTFFAYSATGSTTFLAGQAEGMNSLGEIVGLEPTANGISGYLYSGGTYQTLAVPGAIDTLPTSVNDLGQIVGNFTDATGESHGFLATPLESPVPEPASLFLAGSAAALCYLACRHRQVR